MQKKVIVLGCSGSIGKSTLSIITDFPQKFKVVGLQAHSDKKFLLESSKKFSCTNICLTGKNSNSIKDFIQNTQADIVVNGIAGSAGLLPSVYTLESGKDLALANKETMVMAGKIVKDLALRNSAKILPVDSEHSAIFSLLNKCGKDSVKKLIITASGGPFRNYSLEELEKVTLEKALSHPTWNMGPKITIDSSTLANKGLEVIEAFMLFDFAPEKIQVVVHPQSLVHSMVQTYDGQIYAQISNPDMRHPIFTALTWPECIKNSIDEPDLSKMFEMQFMNPKNEVFPMLNLAYKALEKLGSYSIVYNAANEIAVDAFRKNAIKYTQIPKIVEKTMSYDWSVTCTTINQVLDVDKESRKIATLEMQKITENGAKL